MEKRRSKIVCVSFYDQNYSRGSVYLNSNFVKAYGLDYEKVGPGLKSTLRILHHLARRENPSETIFVVISPSHMLVPLLRLFWRGTIILDAGWPLTDAAFSRASEKIKPWKLAKSLVIDFLSFRTASSVFVESQAQSKRVERKFKIESKKISVLLTGFDESCISLIDDDIQELAKLDASKPIITFRGSSNPESGLDIIAEMSRLQGAKKFNLLICTNEKNPKHNFSLNTHLITRRLSIGELTKIYRMSQIFIGQISNNKRLSFTIPHKAFEAGYFEKPYISIDRIAIRELYPSNNSAFYRVNYDAESLLESILYLMNNPEERQFLSRSISLEYRERANQELLGQRFIQLVLTDHAK